MRVTGASRADGARGRLGRLAAGALALLGLASSSADGRAISPEQAPAAWVAYAEGATRTLMDWLNGDEPPAPRLRAGLDETRPASDQPTPPLVVKIWIGRDGALTRVDMLSAATPTTERDLRTLLIGRRLPVPPRHMRQPLRLALQAARQPEAEGTTVMRGDIPSGIPGGSAGSGAL